MINIEKDNINVREYNSDDFYAFYKRLCQNKDWTDSFPMWGLNQDDAADFFEMHLNQYNDIDLVKKGLILGIFTKNQLLIGSCGFEYNENTKAVEIFFGLSTPARNKGYGKEIISAIEDVCEIIGTKNISCNIPEILEAGIKILDKSKFKYKNNFDMKVENLTVKMRHYRLNEVK